MEATQTSIEQAKFMFAYQLPRNITNFHHIHQNKYNGEKKGEKETGKITN
jgi:hypothetical protein